MDNQNHGMSIKQNKRVVNAHEHDLLNSFCYNGLQTPKNIKRHKNNNKIQSKIKRERFENALMPEGV